MKFGSLEPMVGTQKRSATGRRKDSLMANSSGVRLGTWLPGQVDKRLRMLVLLENKPIGEVLAAVLDKHLPNADDLAARLADSCRNFEAV
jgi:hypothetical protein